MKVLEVAGFVLSVAFLLGIMTFLAWAMYGDAWTLVSEDRGLISF